MDTPRPVHRATLAACWLRRFAALVLFGGSVAGCQSFSESAAPGDNPSANGSTAVAKKDGGFFQWPEWDWEWEDFDYFGWLPKSGPDAPPPNAFVMQGDKLTPVKSPGISSLEARMALAHECFRVQDYAKAEKIFHRIANNEKNPPKLVEEAKFFEAECLRLQDRLPKAGDTYMDLMNKFPRNPYRDQAVQQMYKIANIWLEETRKEMREHDDPNAQHWFETPHFVNFSDPKIPLLDREGRAIQLLEAVRFGDINGPLADRALFLCGSVKFFDEDYKEADYYFTQVSEKHPNGELVEKAIRLAIIAKHMSTGGPDYDGRKVAEARILVQKALDNYPNIDRGFLTDQLVDITKQQAEKDFKMADFWERTGHPGAAVWYYELVVRRYPGTQVAKEAAKRRADIMQQMEKDQVVEPPPKKPQSLNGSLEQAPAPRLLPPDLGTPGR